MSPATSRLEEFCRWLNGFILNEHWLTEDETDEIRRRLEKALAPEPILEWEERERMKREIMEFFRDGGD